MGDRYRLELGTKVKDKVTGLTGIITTRTEFLHGCVRVGVQPQELKDGKPVDPVSFDEPQLEVLAEPADFGQHATAEPRPDPRRHGDRPSPSATRPGVPSR